MAWYGPALTPGTTAPDRAAWLTGTPARWPPFSSVCGSTTCTTPALRFRWAVPVGHHVRVRWYELPASCSTRRIVVALTRGSPSRRTVRSKVESYDWRCHRPSDPVAAARSPRSGPVPSRRRSAAGLRDPSASSPARLNRRTKYVTAPMLR